MAREDMMKAIVQSRYGSPDLLRLEEIAKPGVKDDEVLVRVRAAAVNIGDWHLLRGVPYVMRLVFGLTGPRRRTPGLDIAGQVEAVGRNVKQFRSGDEVFGWCKGAFAEYACTAENNLLRKPTNLTITFQEVQVNRIESPRFWSRSSYLDSSCKGQQRTCPASPAGRSLSSIAPLKARDRLGDSRAVRRRRWRTSPMRLSQRHRSAV
jgi:Alcohol dehydrogenase GroES-like domain